MAVAELRGTVMASQLNVIIGHPRHQTQLPEVRALLQRLESLWSRFIPTSDVSRINTGAGQAVEVAPETILLIETMRQAWGDTQGRYDPTTLPVLMSHGYAVSKCDPARRTVLPGGPYRLGAMGEIGVDRVGSTVTLPVGVAIDPGGIGKGLAADLAVASLLSGGACGALVSIGGDLRVDGEPPESTGWRINIEHAEPTDRPLCQVTVDRGGVATSSTRTRRWNHNGRVRHHVIDPFSGTEADTDLAAVTVFSTSGWQAEAFATAAILGSSANVLDYLDSHDLTGLAITTEGTVLLTHDLDGLVPTAAGVR
ncbi:MAG: FAD:protein FMN transferase [Microthrixaceae bacterium]